jgi:hypothetical protein
MIVSDRMKNTDFPRNTACVLLAFWSYLATMWMVGCRNSDAAVEGLAVRARSEVAALATLKAGDEADSRVGETQTNGVERVEGRDSGGEARITVEKDVCDLGDIGIDTKHTGQFQFTNSGSAPLKIVQVRTCCGVTIKGVAAGQEYAPGQSGTLEFAYQAPSVPNPAVSRVLSLQTNDPEHGTARLTVKATVVRRVNYRPQSLKLIVSRPNAGCPDITLTGIDGQPFAIRGFEATGGV